MDYQEALKEVQSKVPKQNYLVMSFGYGNKYVLPYKDGMALMASMVNAEQLHEPYGEQHRITGVERGAVETHVMSHDAYTRIKIAALLGITPDEVKAAERSTLTK